MIFLAGLAAGYIASWFLPEDMKSKQRKMAKKKMEALKTILTDPEERERIIDIFKERTDEALSQYQNARQMLMENLSEVKGSWQDIDKDKYMEVVANTIEQIRDDQSLPLRQLNKLKQYFEADYKLIQSKVKSMASETA